MNLAFNLVFLVVTTIIAITGFKAYQFFHEKKFCYHSIGFGLISLSYLIIAIANTCAISGIRTFEFVGIYASALFYLAGIMVLLFVYLDIKQESVRALLLVLSLAVVAIFNKPMMEQQGMVFYLLTAVMIGFIVARLLKHYLKQKRTTTLLVLSGFSLLLISQILFGLVIFEKELYVAAAIIALIGYGCISTSRLMVKKDEATTKPRRSHT